MFWDPLFDRISEAAGAPPDQCKLIASLVVSFPLASLFVLIPASRANLAHVYSIAISTFFLWPLLGLGEGLLELLFSCVGTYLIVASVRGPNMPWIAFFFVMTHMTITHLRRTFLNVDVSVIEISAMQMVMVMKLSSFAWNVHDGRQKPENLDDAQRSTRLTRLPNPLAFLGYCFFFPSVLVGPSFDYATYDKLIKHTLYDVAPPAGTPAAAAPARKRRTPKGRRRVAYLHMIIGLVFLALYAVVGERGSYERVNGPDWPTWSLMTRFGFVQFCGFCARIKYYAVWSLSEGACILTGLGFNGYDPKTGRTRWNRVRNVDIPGIEMAESFKVLFDSWNCRTNVWLRDCVYKRLAKKGQKPGPIQSMATFLTSAFWHGIAPGYYLAFVTAGMVQYIGKQLRHLVRPYFLAPSDPQAALKPPAWPSQPLAKRCYDIAGWFMVQINLNYLVAPFLLLHFKPSIMAWTHMYWYTHVLIALFLGVMRAGARRWLKRGLRPREAAKAATPTPPPIAVPAFKLSPPTPDEAPSYMRAEDEDADGDADGPDGPDQDIEWVRYDLQSPSLAKGEGVDVDGGVMDDLMSKMDSDTRPGTPHLKDE